MDVGKYIYPCYAITRPTGTYTLVGTFDSLAEAEAFMKTSPQYWEIRIHEQRRCLNQPIPILENDAGVVFITPALEASCVRL